MAEAKRSNAVTNGTYGLGFIGALIYFMVHAASFGDVMFGILKAILWPAFLIYNLLDFLKM